MTLELPLAELYEGHWSVTGHDPPPADTPDDAVFLPGDAVLIMKPAIWCQLHGISQLALATLSTNPFADNSPAFFAAFETALNAGVPRPVKILRPFGQYDEAAGDAVSERLSARADLFLHRAAEWFALRALQ